MRQRIKEEAIELLSDNSERDQKETAVLTGLIETLIKAGQVDTAHARLADSMRQDFENPDPSFLQARLHIADDEIDNALAIYRTLLNEYPDDPWPLAALNRIFVLTDRQEDLTELFNTASSARPDAVLPRMLRAEQLECLNDINSAIAIKNLYTENSGNQVFANNLVSLIASNNSDKKALPALTSWREGSRARMYLPFRTLMAGSHFAVGLMRNRWIIWPLQRKACQVIRWFNTIWV